jgi:hypothetical protein
MKDKGSTFEIDSMKEGQKPIVARKYEVIVNQYNICPPLGPNYGVKDLSSGVLLGPPNIDLEVVADGLVNHHMKNYRGEHIACVGPEKRAIMGDTASETSYIFRGLNPGEEIEFSRYLQESLKKENSKLIWE